MGELTAASALLAAARWLTYIASLLVIGQAGARFVCRRALRGHASPVLLETIERRQSRLVAVSVMLLALSTAVMLMAHSFHWFGLAGFTDWTKVKDLIGTGWGERWRATAAVAAVSLAAVGVRRRWRRAETPTSLAMAAGVVLAMPLPGHGGSHGVYNWLYRVAHLLGAGLWMGTLAALLVTTRTMWRSGGEATPALLRRLLGSFSPLALFGAALTIGTGSLLAWNHVQTFEFLRDTEFGRTVALKVVAVATAAGLGFLNWRRFTPRAIDDAGRGKLRRVAIAEAVVAFIVILALTGWLSGQQSPDTFE